MGNLKTPGSQEFPTEQQFIGAYLNVGFFYTLAQVKSKEIRNLLLLNT